MRELPKEDFARLDSTKTFDASGVPNEGVVLAMLTIKIPGKDDLKFPLTNLNRKVVLGRDPRCDIPLDDPAVSRLHAIIAREHEKFSVEDLDSKNGTILKGKLLRSGKLAKLTHGDQIRIGRITILYESSTPEETAKAPQPSPMETVSSAQRLISTGYLELDAQLGGGLPEGYAFLLLSPSCDERDLILGRIVESVISSQGPAIYLSTNLSRIRQFVDKYPQDFFAFSSYVGNIVGSTPNVMEISSLENLSDLGISISSGLSKMRSSDRKSKFMVIDVLLDILLRHKSVTTRRWLSDFIAKRKSQGFTLLATLNPATAPESDVQAVLDLFDGILTIYDRKVKGHIARFLVITKLFGRRYAQTELMIDREKLF